MYDRFTDGARRVVEVAYEEARKHGHDHVGTEHLLLGLLREERNQVGRVLEALDITLESVCAVVLRIVGSRGTDTFGPIPFDSRARQAVLLALDDALWLEHDCIRPEHLLLGLLRGDRGVAAQVLDELQADQDHIRAQTLSSLGVSWASGLSPAELELTRNEHEIRKWQEIRRNAATDEERRQAGSIIRIFNSKADRVRRSLPA